MTKQSDLSSASVLGRASSSRIWRTVVFSGAMLGAPLIASADTPPPQKQPADAKKAPEQANKPPTMTPTKPSPPPMQEPDTVESVMALIAEMDLTIKTATAAADEAVKKAKQVAADEAAKVTTLRKQKGDLDKRLRAAKTKAKADEAAAKRPRATEIRPVGRGFVLA